MWPGRRGAGGGGYGEARNSAATHPSERSDGSRTWRHVPAPDGAVRTDQLQLRSIEQALQASPGRARRRPQVDALRTRPTTRRSGCPGGSASPVATTGWSSGENGASGVGAGRLAWQASPSTTSSAVTPARAARSGTMALPARVPRPTTVALSLRPEERPREHRSGPEWAQSCALVSRLPAPPKSERALGLTASRGRRMLVEGGWQTCDDRGGDGWRV